MYTLLTWHRCPYEKEEVAVLLLRAFYLQRLGLFFSNHSSVFIAVIATILAVMLWHVDSVASLQFSGYELKSWLAGHLIKGVYTVGGRCVNARWCTQGENVQCKGAHTENVNFFKFVIKIDQSKANKSHIYNKSLQLTYYQCLMAK